MLDLFGLFIDLRAEAVDGFLLRRHRFVDLAADLPARVLDLSAPALVRVGHRVLQRRTGLTGCGVHVLHGGIGNLADRVVGACHGVRGLTLVVPGCLHQRDHELVGASSHARPAVLGCGIETLHHLLRDDGLLPVEILDRLRELLVCCRDDLPGSGGIHSRDRRGDIRAECRDPGGGLRRLVIYSNCGVVRLLRHPVAGPWTELVKLAGCCLVLTDQLAGQLIGRSLQAGDGVIGHLVDVLASAPLLVVDLPPCRIHRFVQMAPDVGRLTANLAGEIQAVFADGLSGFRSGIAYILGERGRHLPCRRRDPVRSVVGVVLRCLLLADRNCSLRASVAFTYCPGTLAHAELFRCGRARRGTTVKLRRLIGQQLREYLPLLARLAAHRLELGAALCVDPVPRHGKAAPHLRQRQVEALVNSLALFSRVVLQRLPSAYCGLADPFLAGHRAGEDEFAVHLRASVE